MPPRLIMQPGLLGAVDGWVREALAAPVFVLKTNLDNLTGGSRHVLVVWFVWSSKTNLLFARQNCQDELAFCKTNCQDKLAFCKTNCQDALAFSKIKSSRQTCSYQDKLSRQTWSYQDNLSYAGYFYLACSLLTLLKEIKCLHILRTTSLHRLTTLLR